MKLFRITDMRTIATLQPLQEMFSFALLSLRIARPRPKLLQFEVFRYSGFDLEL